MLYAEISTDSSAGKNDLVLATKGRIQSQFPTNMHYVAFTPAGMEDKLPIDWSVHVQLHGIGAACEAPQLRRTQPSIDNDDGMPSLTVE